MGQGLTSEEAMRQGKAILDGGATRTFGSVVALEQLMSVNQEKQGDSGLYRVDAVLRPVFGFGNSSSDRCMSTAWLKVKAGDKDGNLTIHALDRGQSPILFSIEALRSLGAVIDFQEDLVCFRNLDATRIIELERSCTGHQLLPLTDDWFHNAKQAKGPVQSLRALI